jgi:hypothetical protein
VTDTTPSGELGWDDEEVPADVGRRAALGDRQGEVKVDDRVRAPSRVGPSVDPCGVRLALGVLAVDAEGELGRLAGMHRQKAQEHLAVVV